MVIHVRELGKVFSVPERAPGLSSALRGFVRGQSRAVPAVRGISFDIEEGEIVGFLGPNGAGKSTTLKMLAGVLAPTSGEARVLGQVPFRRHREFLGSIALLMGNRRQLQWDLPAADSFELNRAIYGIEWPRYRRVLGNLVEMLEAGDLLNKPVRNLSLGERMKVEFIGSLLHSPAVLFLDEPTIGLDLAMQKRIRAFVAEHNRVNGATVLLTSHYMADIEALCPRVMVIDRGALLYDGRLRQLGRELAAYRDLEVTMPDGRLDLGSYGRVTRVVGDRVRLRVLSDDIAGLVRDLVAEDAIRDLTITEPPVEDLIEQLLLERGSRGALDV